jgi:hypothetical protein
VLPWDWQLSQGEWVQAAASLTTALAAIVAVVIASVALVVARDARDAENSQAQAANEALSIARDQLNQLRLHQLTPVKADAYSTLFVECDRHRQQLANQVEWLKDEPASRGDPPKLESTEKAERAYLTLQLTNAPTIVQDFAAGLLDRTVELGSSFRVTKIDQRWSDDLDERWRENLERWTRSRWSFLGVAKLDLWDPTPLDSRWMPSLDVPTDRHAGP